MLLARLDVAPSTGYARSHAKADPISLARGQGPTRPEDLGTLRIPEDLEDLGTPSVFREKELHVRLCSAGHLAVCRHANLYDDPQIDQIDGALQHP